VRIFERLDELYSIGGGPGANRIGYTPEEDEAHRLAADWMRDAGLEVSVDGSGNLVGRLPGGDPLLPELWTGSHLDSVPQGGRFDGALGVVAGIEALERLGARSRTLAGGAVRGPGGGGPRRSRTLAVVAFRDEERGCAGSRGRCAAGGLPGAFVELHHEQGPRLAAAGTPLGVVTGIVGYKRGTRTIDGRAGHAGTTPMLGRQDALVAAAEEVLRIRDAALSIKDAVATVGQLEVEPGGTNVIPNRVTFSLDVRAPDADRLSRLTAAVGLDNEGRTEPVAMAEPVRAALRAAVESSGLPVVELASGAGHDAGILAAAGVEAGMLFVRAGADGVSHSPDEAAAKDDVELAVDVLTDALERLSAP
jgi:acetylornithine deacetylase/succinyl-diaminopimelate desuccinylase-like protein